MAIEVDPTEVLDVVQARAAQTYAELLLEIGRITAYARSLERRVMELEAPKPE